jgi:hypothetical protein
MTNSPVCLQKPRNLVIQNLDAHPGKTVDDDLDPAEVGIVGDPNHRGGYHCGKDRLDSNDYSVRESPRDKNGLTLDAAALDIGWFEWRNSKTGVAHTLRTFSRWVVSQCEVNAPDTRDIREIIYSLDGKTVKRWDRLEKSTTGDNSHLSHTHFSFFRDAVKAGRDQSPLFRRYLQTIGLLAGGDDDMTPEQDARLKDIEKWILNLDGRTAQGVSYLRISGAEGDRNGYSLTELHAKVDLAINAISQLKEVDSVELDAKLEELRQAVNNVDEEVLAKLGDVNDPGETAQILKALLGEHADDVFRAGLGLPAA